jgi:hypothetical protein
MASTKFERRSMAAALLTYLQARSWNVTEIKEGFQHEEPVVAPTVSVHFLPSRFQELQMGRDKKSFARRVQIDCYMEQESRAEAIVDDIMDFVDDVPIPVVNENSQQVAMMICYNTESIEGDVLNPVYNRPEILRWRGVISATYECHYEV